MCRTRAEITDALRSAGFVILDPIPMFVLMSYPAEAGMLAQVAWSAIIGPETVSD
ncbi:MAG TPA: hypothetical protein VJU82_08140 [Acidobacteriaceae bacterium]|nr:hypothetical protein [Acidobacteriaceae bacterium]